MNSSRLAATAGRIPSDVAEVGQDLVVRSPVGVAQDRGVAADRGQRVPVDGQGERSARRPRARRPDRRRSPGRPARRARRAGPACSSAGTANRRPRSASPSLIRHSGVLMSRIDALQAAAPIDQVGLLPGVLEVVARIRLVGDGVHEVRGATRQVDVDVDPRAAAAVEPVVAGPRLVRHQRDPQVLAVGQAEQRGRPGPEARDEPVDDGRQPIDRDLELARPSVPGARRATRRRGGARRGRRRRPRTRSSGRRGGAYAKHRATCSR